MLLGLDISSTRIRYSYSINGQIQTIVKDDCAGINPDGELNKNELCRIFPVIRSEMEHISSERITKMVIGIPFSCTHSERRWLREAIKFAGFPRTEIEMRFAVDLADMWLVNTQEFGNNAQYGIMLKASQNYLEAAFYRNSGNVAGVLGSMGIKVNRVSSVDEFLNLEKRIKANFKQFAKDCGIPGAVTETAPGAGVDANSPVEVRMIADGCYKNTITCIQKCTRECFQKDLVLVPNTSSLGALFLGQCQEGLLVNEYASVDLRNVLMRGITAKLGENGEFVKLVDYNTPLPVSVHGRLLISTEPTLRIFEGNYGNAKYDEVIGVFPFPEELEGHEIDVGVKIEKNMDLWIKIVDLKTGEELIPEKRL